MKEQKPKLPTKEGLKKARDIFESLRKRQPSDELVKIISEIPEIESDQPKKDDQAAKEVEI